MQSQNQISFPSFAQAKKKRKVVKPVNYTNDVCDKQLSLFEKQELSDICIIGSDDVRFHAHKIVLAVGSDFFMSMFEGALKESKASEVKIQEVNGETLKLILVFIYTGNIELQTETVEDILRAANYFQIKPLIVECYNFMGEELDAKNCLAIAMFAEQHGLIELYDKASKFACSHFEQIFNEEEFLDLNENQVSTIICSKDLCVPSEETIFLSLIKWIEHDKLNRENFAFQLFSHVRYWLLSSTFIKQQRNKLPKLVECVEMICTWLEWHLSPDSSGLKSRDFSKIENPNEKLIFIGKGKKHTYNPELNTWSSEALPGFPLSFEKIVETNNKLIIRNHTSLHCFDLETNEMSELPRLECLRINFGLAVYKNELYAVGGHYNNSWKRLVDKYNFSSGKWQAVAPMNQPLINPVVAVADGRLYVKGNGNTIECFNPDSIEWTTMNFPHSDISNFGFTVVNEKLFVVGGRSPPSTFKSDLYDICYTFDPSSGIWLHENMRLKLSSPKCTSWHNRLIVCGGYDDTGTLLNLVQEYNPITKKWRILAPVDQLNDDYYEIINIQNENICN